MLPSNQYITHKTDLKLVNDIITCCIKDSYTEHLTIKDAVHYSWHYRFDDVSLISAAIQANKFCALKKIYIEQIHINEQPKSICNCLNPEIITNCLKAELLQEIKILNCEVSNIALAMGFKNLDSNATLRKLDFSFSNLRYDDMRNISIYVKKSKSLQELILACTGITDEGVKILAEAIQVNVTLLVLDLVRNPISVVGVVAIGKCLTHNKTLKKNVLTYLIQIYLVRE